MAKQMTSLRLHPVSLLTLRKLAEGLDIYTPTGTGAGRDGSVSALIDELANLAAIMGTPAMPGASMAELLRPYLDTLREMRAEAGR